MLMLYITQVVVWTWHNISQVQLFKSRSEPNTRLRCQNNGLFKLLHKLCATSSPAYHSGLSVLNFGCCLKFKNIEAHTACKIRNVVARPFEYVVLEYYVIYLYSVRLRIASSGM